MFAAELRAFGNSNTHTFWRNPDCPRDLYGGWPPDDRESLLAFAHATVKHHRGIDPSVPLGRALRLAKLTEHTIAVQVVGDLGMPSNDDDQTERTMRPKTLPSLVIAAALGACGGSGDVEINAMNLAQRAATDTQSVVTVSGSAAVTGGTSAPVVNSLSYTNNTDAAVTVQIEHSLAFGVTATGSALGTGKFESQVWMPSGTNISLTDLPNVGQTTPQADTYYSIMEQYTVAIGVTIRVDLLCITSIISGVGTVTTSYHSVNTRMTAIKK